VNFVIVELRARERANEGVAASEKREERKRIAASIEPPPVDRVVLVSLPLFSLLLRALA